MESLSDDLVAGILRRVRDSRDLKACAQVCAQWHRLEGVVRTSLRILDPLHLPQTLARYPNLSTLQADIGINDEDLASIAQFCPSLRSLNLDVNKYRRMMDMCLSDEEVQDSVSDRGLAAIAAGCADLRWVSLRWRQALGDHGIGTLAASCRVLTHLDLAHCRQVSDASLEALATAASLQVLVLRSCSAITDSGLFFLSRGAAANSLRSLNLDSCDRLTDSGVSFLKRMSGLETLSLAECGLRITDIGGVDIATITSLKVLNLSWLLNISDTTLLALCGNCPHLTELNLTGCELVTGAGIHPLSMHKSLEAVCLAACPSLYVQDVVALRNLKYLALDHQLKPWMTLETLAALQRHMEIVWR